MSTGGNISAVSNTKWYRRACLLDWQTLCVWSKKLFRNKKSQIKHGVKKIQCFSKFHCLCNFIAKTCIKISQHASQFFRKAVATSGHNNPPKHPCEILGELHTGEGCLGLIRPADTTRGWKGLQRYCQSHVLVNNQYVCPKNATTEHQSKIKQEISVLPDEPPPQES